MGVQSDAAKDKG